MASVFPYFQEYAPSMAYHRVPGRGSLFQLLSPVMCNHLCSAVSSVAILTSASLSIHHILLVWVLGRPLLGTVGCWQALCCPFLLEAFVDDSVTIQMWTLFQSCSVPDMKIYIKLLNGSGPLSHTAPYFLARLCKALYELWITIGSISGKWYFH